MARGVRWTLPVRRALLPSILPTRAGQPLLCRQPLQATARGGRLLRAPALGTMPPMRWTAQKSEQFQALRRAEGQGLLAEEDRVALDGLLADLDADEAEALEPAGEKLDARAQAMDAERAELDSKAGELERHIAELRTTVESTTDDIQRLSGSKHKA